MLKSLILLATLIPGVSFGFSAQVTKVLDGDTIEVRVKSPAGEPGKSAKFIRIRLAEIDAPEVAKPKLGIDGQPFGQESAEALRRAILYRAVEVDPAEGQTTDQYHRVIAIIRIGNVSVNQVMVRGGYAWAYKAYVKSPGILDAERAAQQAKVGLWALPDADREEPWLWRKAQKKLLGQ